MSARPPIGINLDFEEGELARSALRHTYYDAVFAGGGHPVLIPPILDRGYIDQALSGVRGLVLTGGDDLDPVCYGARTRHDTCKLAPDRRLKFDLLLARAAIDRGIPIFGICLGMQTLNVVMGGDLIQDVPGHKGCEHEVVYAGGQRLVVNSSHHQAVDRIAPGLRATARAPDGTIEAIEGANLLGVQWHPERIIEREPHLRLFADFCKIAAHGNRR